jgi:aminotransferase EvaB
MLHPRLDQAIHLKLKAINDLARHLGPLHDEITAVVERVVQSGWFVLGEHVRSFESAFAAYCATAHCVTVANGTDALELALRALDIGPGRRVATVANAGMYGSTAILAAGARPVFVDVAAHTMLMDLGQLYSLLATGSVDAVLATHLYGAMLDMSAVAAMCRERGVPLVEDCAQAHGARWNGRRAGSFGDAGCFSFYPTKNLGALGDGGAVVTSRTDVADRVRALRQYGWTTKYVSSVAGGRNSRLDELQAALLLAMLPRLDGWNQQRRDIAARYSAGIRHPRVACPAPRPASDESSVGHLYVVRTPQRDALKAHLAAHGMPYDVHYPVPDHRQPALQAAFAGCTLPVTDALAMEVLSLPCFPEMTDAEVADVIACVNGW